MDIVKVRTLFEDVSQNYEINSLIGKGSYGFVVSAVDRIKGKSVAIKRIRLFDCAQLYQRILREIRILSRFSHENIIDLQNCIPIFEHGTLSHIYFFSSLLDCDLDHLLRITKLSKEHMKYFTYQLLRGLKYIHSANVIHRDLKPSNILINANCDLKIADFGLARIVDPSYNHAGLLTECVATLWYRAPEVILSSCDYNNMIDIWAAGCIIGEMFTYGKPLFPGDNYVTQINVIISIIGSLDETDLLSIKNLDARKYVASLDNFKKRDFSEIMPSADQLGLDMLEQMLCFNPEMRISVCECLNHPYLAEYFDPGDEPVIEHPFTLDLEFDDYPLNTLRELIIDEIKKKYGCEGLFLLNT